MFHERFSPRVYKFYNSFFWFKIDILNLNRMNAYSPLLSHNKFNLYSFYDSHYLQLGEVTLADNILKFFRMNGVSKKFVTIEIYTHLAFLGYIFNPVSFILAKDESDVPHGIIVIGNTFGEVKPYYISPDAFQKDNTQFNVKVDKFFYVSPFVPMDSSLDFSFQHQDQKLSIQVNDYLKADGRKVIETRLTGKELRLSTLNLILMTLQFPFITLQVITLIHWHAFRLYFKKIFYFRKKDTPHFQKEFLKWKKL